MKRIFVFAVATLVAVGSVFADEKSLIDFRELKADITPDGQKVLNIEDSPRVEFTQNDATKVDFQSQAGLGATPAQKAAMLTSLAIENWNVVFTSSARTLENKRLSYTREAESKLRDDDGNLTEETETVMGVRIHFPVEAYNSSARIVPPFPIPGFDKESTDEGRAATAYAPASRFKPEEDPDNPGTANKGRGIIYNVGTIKSVQADVYGLNFPHKLSIILIDNLGNEKIIPMGTLNYEGWGKLTWNNPQYVADVRNREQRLYPIYPQSQTFVRFGGFIVQKDASQPGGDFIGYFKEVRVIYDQAVLETTPREIDDELEWKIIDTRESVQNRTDLLQFGNNAVQQYLDTARQAQGGERGISAYDPAYPTANPTTSGAGAGGTEQPE